jgi:nucleotide-binding universal stress UspA family protein
MRHIVAATDFSAASLHGVERAASLAHAHGARLTLHHVVAATLWEDTAARLSTAVGIDTLSPEAAQQEAAERLQRQADELAARTGVACAALTTIGRPVAQIAQLATSGGADLVVVGAHGAHPVRQLVVGTSAQKLLRVSPCPVLIVKRAPPFDYRIVLAPTDFSPPSAAALRAAAGLLPAAMLHIAHAFELPYDGLMRYANVDAGTMAHYRTAAAERLHADLLAFADDAGIAPGRRVLHVEHGYPPTRIDRWIEAIGADLVAIAAHGRSELEATFLGSVSLHAALAAPCDVLLLRGAAFG